MAQWRIKEISDLTKISVRMLRHYDKIGLLKPFSRSENGYRWYSEQDLATLQQIIALKFFGFSLGQIKTMLQQKRSIREHLTAQHQMLKEQAMDLQQAQDSLASVLQRCKTSKSLDWNDLITLIERYRVAKELKKTWIGKLNEEQQENYIKMHQKYPKEFDAWNKAIEEINGLKLGDPEGPDCERIIKVYIAHAKVIKKDEEQHKDNKYVKISNSKIKRTAKELVGKNIPFSPEGNMWFAKALVAYRLKQWENIYQEISENLNIDPKGDVGKKIVQKWREIINEQLIGSPDFALGTMLWQDAARDKPLLAQEPNSTPRPKPIKLLLDPSAVHWINTALISH
jgi:DNA-binding transcriptional MerR regulator